MQVSACTGEDAQAYACFVVCIGPVVFTVTRDAGVQFYTQRTGVELNTISACGEAHVVVSMNT